MTDPMQGIDPASLEHNHPDDEKLRQLILHIARECADDETFGAVKLNKLLFFADFQAYLELGKAITRQPYVKLPHGPVPDRMRFIKASMELEGATTTEQSQQFYHRQQRTVALKEPNLSLFSADEVRIVDHAIRRWWGCTATEMSHASHSFIGWQLAKDGEIIPYESALFFEHEPTEAEAEMARSLRETAEKLLSDRRR